MDRIAEDSYEKARIHFLLKDYRVAESALRETEQFEAEARQAHATMHDSMIKDVPDKVAKNLSDKAIQNWQKEGQRSGEIAMDDLRVKRLTLLADIFLTTGSHNDALTVINETGRIMGDSPARQIRYRTQKGALLRATNQAAAASLEYLQAVIAIEQLRGSIKEDKAGFFTAEYRMAAYRGLVGTLVDRAIPGDQDRHFAAYGTNLASAAFYFSEATKARTILEKIIESGKMTGRIPEGLASRPLPAEQLPPQG
jgi:hypothetical protein